MVAHVLQKMTYFPWQGVPNMLLTSYQKAYSSCQYWKIFVFWTHFENSIARKESKYNQPRVSVEKSFVSMQQV
jgi:hypothetical protein